LNFWARGCRCGSQQIRRSTRRTVLDYVISMLFLPYRCEMCAMRMFKLRGVYPASPGRSADQQKPTQ
jgi:hypothetical protein